MSKDSLVAVGRAQTGKRAMRVSATATPECAVNRAATVSPPVGLGTGSAFVRDAVEKWLGELREKCAVEKEGLRHATAPGRWGQDGPGETYWADMKAKCAVERKETYAQALNALERFIAEHRAIMGVEWIGNDHGRLCWAPYLGGVPIGQHYCQLPEGHDGKHANELGAWPQGVMNEHQWHALLRPNNELRDRHANNQTGSARADSLQRFVTHPIRVLNLYAGVGGNRKNWQGVEVTAVELEPKIAAVYQRLNPHDHVIVGDAHAYLLENYDRFDFIWTSPPCQTHSKMAKATRHKLKRYPDMSLYQQIIFLQTYAKGAWCVENVVPYYAPLIQPTAQVGRHLFWSNFPIVADEVPQPANFINKCNLAGKAALMEWLGIHYAENIYYGKNHCPAQILRNCVHPKLGAQILEAARMRNAPDDRPAKTKP